MFTRLGSSVVMPPAKTEVARTAAGFLASVIIPLLDEDNDPWGWLGEVLRNLGDFFTILAKNVLKGVPTTPLEIITFFFGDSLRASLDAWYAKLLQGPQFSGSFAFEMMGIFSLVGAAFLIFKVSTYFVKLGAYSFKYSNAEIARGETSLTSPLVYIPFRFLPAMFLVLAGPALVIGTLRGVYLLVSDMILAIYQSETIGTVTFNLILQMIEGKGVVWFALTFPFFLALLTIFLIEFALLYLYMIGAACWSFVQIARYGDGESPGFVITDRVYLTLKAVALVGVVWFMLFLGPQVMTSGFLSWAPAAIRIIVWLVALIIAPILLIKTTPSIEQRVERIVVTNLRETVAPSGPYVPANRFLNPAGRVEGRGISEETLSRPGLLKRGLRRSEDIFRAYRTFA